MGRLIIIMLLGAGVLFSIASINNTNSNLVMASATYSENQRLQAKDNAESGIEMAIMKLSADTTWTGITSKQLESGVVTISVENTTSEFYNGPNTNLVSARLITSVGNVGDQYDTIRSVIQLPVAGTSNNGVPGFMDYAVCTGNDLTMNGNVSIQDDNNTQWNANVHTNADFSMNGNTTIKGFMTYYSEAHSNPQSRLTTNIVPNQNPQNLPHFYQDSIVTIPTFNPDNYKSSASIVYTTNKTLNGNIVLGTKDNPQIIYVGGDLNLNGNVTGYGVFIVKGNILINGNVTVNSVDANGSNVGLYTAGDLTANGNVKIYAQILTGGNANLNGNCKVYGSVTTKGTVNFNGNVNIYYRPATGALTTPFWTSTNSSGNGLIRPQILSYY